MIHVCFIIDSSETLFFTQALPIMLLKVQVVITVSDYDDDIVSKKILNIFYILFQHCSFTMTSTRHSWRAGALVDLKWRYPPVQSLEMRSLQALTRARWEKNVLLFFCLSLSSFSAFSWHSFLNSLSLFQCWRAVGEIFFMFAILGHDPWAESMFLLHLSSRVWQNSDHFNNSLWRILPHCKPGKMNCDSRETSMICM